MLKVLKKVLEKGKRYAKSQKRCKVATLQNFHEFKLLHVKFFTALKDSLNILWVFKTLCKSANIYQQMGSKRENNF